MNSNSFAKDDFWRAIILYGLNQATYKIVLGQSLIRFTEQQKSFISMNEVAEDFFDIYLERLRDGEPQLVIPNRQATMKRIVNDKITRTKAIERIEREAFNDVIERFHTVDRLETPMRFYEKTDKGLIIFNSIYDIFSNHKNFEQINELNARWDLLESAFEIKRNNS